METFAVREAVHTWEREAYVWGYARKCKKCSRIEEHEAGEGFTLYEEGVPEACEVDVQKCVCLKTHSTGHSACYKAGEHVCSPCECDCHY